MRGAGLEMRLKMTLKMTLKMRLKMISSNKDSRRRNI